MPSLRSLLCLPPSSSHQPAELDGGPLPNEPSVFLHIERGLRQSPHGLAVISTPQPPEHLLPLVGKPSHDEACLAWTYTQLHRAALRLASGMLAHGAQHNTTLLMLIPNGVEYTVLLWTAVILRVTIVPAELSLLEDTKHGELQEMIRLVKPAVIVVQGARDAEVVDVALRSLSSNNDDQNTNETDILGITLTETRTTKTQSTWKSLLNLGTASPALSATEAAALLSAARADDPSRTHSILFTSGTSGKPKGCPLRVSGMTHVMQSQSWLVNPENSARALQQAHNARGIAPVQTLQTWREGGAVVMTGDGFNASDLVDAIESYRVTFIVLTPAMVHAVSAELGRRSCSGKMEIHVDSVKTVQIGGDAVTRDTLDKCSKVLFPRARVVVNHGMTEVGGGGAFWWPFTSARKTPFYGEMSPVGAVAAGAVVRIWDAEERAVMKRGGLGELHVCCGSTIPEYLEGVSGESFYEGSDGRRWFDTGDVGMMDRQGVVFLLGRRRDMIQTGGGVVMPAPLESCLEKFTSSQACVVNVGGPFAVLERFTGKVEARIKRHVVRTLGKHYALRGVVFLQQLGLSKFPVNATHKIVRAEVEEAVLRHLSDS
ncbi:hypothetical protein BJX76DRAFT_367259 [Aspergillus varians]